MLALALPLQLALKLRLCLGLMLSLMLMIPGYKKVISVRHFFNLSMMRLARPSLISKMDTGLALIAIVCPPERRATVVWSAI
ncbi:MAG: hypothetical protein AAFP85_03685 [Pseudomonadota bacterium]